MATKAIYQHHERTTLAAVVADLQSRETGMDGATGYFVGYNATLAAAWYVPTSAAALTASTIPKVNASSRLADSAITDNGTNVVVGASKVTIVISNGNTTVAGTFTASTTSTFTGVATFNSSGGGASSSIVISAAIPALLISESDQGADAKNWELVALTSNLRWRTTTDAHAAAGTFFNVTRSGSAVTDITFGNTTNNNTVTFAGTGLASFGGSVSITGAVNCSALLTANSGVTIAGANLILNNTSSALATNAFATIAGTSSAGGAYPFLESGHLLLYSRQSGATRDIVFLTGNGATIRGIVDRTGPLKWGYDLVVYSDNTFGTAKFTVTAASGNTSIVGTCDVTGNFAVNTNKFTVTASSGNTLAAGTLTATGAINSDSTTDSTSTTTGSVQTDGGLGVAKAAFIGGLVSANASILSASGGRSSTGAGGTSGSPTSVDVTGKARIILAPTGASQYYTLANPTDGQIVFIVNNSSDALFISNGAGGHLFTVYGSGTNADGNNTQGGAIALYDSTIGTWRKIASTDDPV